MSQSEEKTKFIWPWQYPSLLRESQRRIQRLKLAGWEAVSAWYLAAEDYSTHERIAAKGYNFHREYNVFARDEDIDGPRPSYIEYHKSSGVVENKEGTNYEPR